MKGHLAIIEMRRQRKRPAIVFLNDYPCETDWAENNETPTICVYGDPLPSLDLRYLMGLKVSISALTESRARALFAASKKAGATFVAACHIKDNLHGFQQDGWTEIWEKTP